VGIRTRLTNQPEDIPNMCKLLGEHSAEPLVMGQIPTQGWHIVVMHQLIALTALQ